MTAPCFHLSEPRTVLDSNPRGRPEPVRPRVAMVHPGELPALGDIRSDVRKPVTSNP